jgi:hypothetical protein
MQEHPYTAGSLKEAFNIKEMVRDKSLYTPGNFVIAAILLVGGVITLLRFTGGFLQSPTWTTTTPGASGSGLIFLQV